MTTILLLILDVVMAAIAYLLYMSVFVPLMAKNAAYNKLKAKERAEIDRKLDAEHYFGAKLESETLDIDIAAGLKKGLKWLKKRD
jgi:hypothetical protein